MAKQKKLISEMTTRELKKYIRKEVKKANTRLRNIRKRKRGVSRAVQQELDYLEQMGIVNKRGKAITSYRTARKAELQRRARELEYFNQWTGAETQVVAKEKDYKKYQTFVKNNPKFANYSYQDWRDLVSTFGAMEDKLTEFEYEDMKNLHLEKTKAGSRQNFIKAMEEAQQEAAGKGLTTDDLTDIVRSKLFI